MGANHAVDIDRAVALMIVGPSSQTVHRLVREARTLEAEARSRGEAALALSSKDLLRDALSLHDAVVTLESDPEIVKRNMLARVITAVFPVINGLENLRNLPKKDLWEIALSALSIAAEISTGTQYLEAANLAAKAHFERDMVRLEERVLELAEIGGSAEGMRGDIESYFDSLREKDIPTTQRPVVPFVLWLLICVVSYKRLKASMGPPL